MNRRDFLKTLAAIPALAWLKPEVPEFEAIEAESELAEVGPITGLAIGPGGSIYIGGEFTPVSNDEYWARWNRMKFEPVEGFKGVTAREVTIDYRDYCQPSKLAKMDDSGLWESADGGKTWELAIKSQSLT